MPFLGSKTTKQWSWWKNCKDGVRQSLIEWENQINDSSWETSRRETAQYAISRRKNINLRENGQSKLENKKTISQQQNQGEFIVNSCIISFI